MDGTPTVKIMPNPTTPQGISHLSQWSPSKYKKIMPKPTAKTYSTITETNGIKTDIANGSFIIKYLC